MSKEVKSAHEKGAGPDKTCEYYPCHFRGQDCAWCYCPFYPCNDPATGGKYKKSSRTGKQIWSCLRCRWVHEARVSRMVFEGLRGKSLGKKELARLRDELLEAEDEG